MHRFKFAADIDVLPVEVVGYFGVVGEMNDGWRSMLFADNAYEWVAAFDANTKSEAIELLNGYVEDSYLQLMSHSVVMRTNCPFCGSEYWNGQECPDCGRRVAMKQKMSRIQRLAQQDQWRDYGDWWQLTLPSGAVGEITEQSDGLFVADCMNPQGISMDTKYNIFTLEEAKAYAENFLARYAKRARRVRRASTEVVYEIQNQLNGAREQFCIFYNDSVQKWGWQVQANGTPIFGSDAIFDTDEDAIADFEKEVMGGDVYRYAKVATKKSRRVHPNKRTAARRRVAETKTVVDEYGDAVTYYQYEDLDYNAQQAAYDEWWQQENSGLLIYDATEEGLDSANYFFDSISATVNDYEIDGLGGPSHYNVGLSDSQVSSLAYSETTEIPEGEDDGYFVAVVLREEWQEKYRPGLVELAKKLDEFYAAGSPDTDDVADELVEAYEDALDELGDMAAAEIENDRIWLLSEDRFVEECNEFGWYFEEDGTFVGEVAGENQPSLFAKGARRVNGDPCCHAGFKSRVSMPRQHVPNSLDGWIPNRPVSPTSHFYDCKPASGQNFTICLEPDGWYWIQGGNGSRNVSGGPFDSDEEALNDLLYGTGMYARKGGRKMAKRVKRAQESIMQDWEYHSYDNTYRIFDFVGHEFEAVPNGSRWDLYVSWGNDDMSDWGDGGYPHVIGTFNTLDELDAFVTTSWWDSDKWAKKARAKKAMTDSADLEQALEAEAPFDSLAEVEEFVWEYIDNDMIYYDDQWEMLQTYSDPKEILEALAEKGHDVWYDLHNDVVDGMSTDLDTFTKEFWEVDAKRASRSKKASLNKVALQKKFADYAMDVALYCEDLLDADAPFEDEDAVREYIDSCIDNKLIYTDDIVNIIRDYGDVNQVLNDNPEILEDFLLDVYSNIDDLSRWVEEESGGEY